MKRYLVFAFEGYSALGGMDDLIGDCDTFKEAQQKLSDWGTEQIHKSPFYTEDNIWGSHGGHIFDLEKKEIVYER